MITRREVLKSGALGLVTIGLPGAAFGQEDVSVAEFLGSGGSGDWKV